VAFATSPLLRPAAPGYGGASTADLVWERYQEQAAIAFRSGDAILSSRLWTKALAVAGKLFVPGDPRRATSLTNQALVLRRRRQDYQANQLFQQAFEVWDQSWRWIHLMSPIGTLPNQGNGHQLNVYGPEARAWFNALAQQGRAATAALERHDRRLDQGLDWWFTIKPSRMCDLRKLLAAALLIAPKARV
jgi:hypothetical protein